MKGHKPEELGVEYPAYLNGLAEVIGELRRYMLDRMREDTFLDRIKLAKLIFDWMERIYSALMQFTHHDAITGKLRFNLDRYRGVVEKSREDLTRFIMEERFLNRIKQK